MPRRPHTEPRKSASQDRSRDTIDALVKATAHILVKEGYEKTSTNKIAKAAGASIGSLYQYFPNKEALVAAVIDRHKDELLQVVRNAIIGVAALPVEVAMRELVKMAIDAHRLNPKLHRVLAEQIPRVGRLEKVALLEREGLALFRAYLEAHRAELAVADLDVAAFICVTTIEALTHAAVVNRPTVLTEEDAERLVTEATRLLNRYLHA